MVLELKKDISNLKMILHGKQKNPTDCSLSSKSWNVHSNAVLLNNTFFTDIKENSYEKGYEILDNQNIKIEGIHAKVVKDDEISSINTCDLELNECECIEMRFKDALSAGNTYAMRVGFFIVPPQSSLRFFVNKMRYLIHYYTTFSINYSDNVKINELKDMTIPVNPKNSSLFIFPPAKIKVEQPSKNATLSYERPWKPLSKELMKKPLMGYRWDIDKIKINTEPIYMDSSTPLSFTFTRFNPGHPIGYIALLLVILQYTDSFSILFYAMILIFVIIYVLISYTFEKRLK